MAEWEPGHYEIRVKTNRLGDRLVTTNAVGIDLVPMKAEAELEQVKSLMSKIALPGPTREDHPRSARRRSHVWQLSRAMLP
jgi:hypothetical protein